MKKKDFNKENVRPILQKNENPCPVDPGLTRVGGKLAILSAHMPLYSHPPIKKLSIHFPEGNVITLKFVLTRRETDPSGYDHQTYQLTKIGLGLEVVRLGPETINLIKNEMKSVSLRHTS